MIKMVKHHVYKKPKNKCALTFDIFSSAIVFNPYFCRRASKQYTCSGILSPFSLLTISCTIRLKNLLSVPRGMIAFFILAFFFKISSTIFVARIVFGEYIRLLSLSIVFRKLLIFRIR